MQTFPERDVIRRERAEAPRPRHFLFSLCAMLFASVMLAFSYFILSSDFFRVRRIEVAGVQGAPEAELVGRTTAYLAGRGTIASWLGPENILFWRMAPAHISFAGMYPIIAEVVRTVDVGERSVHLVAKEREGFGVWCAGESACYAFDREGVIFAKAPKSEGTLVLRVRDMSGKEPLVGAAILPRTEWRENFFKTLEILEGRNVPMREIIVRGLDVREWEVKTAYGFSLLFSLDFTPDNLSAVLRDLEKRISLSALSYLDFRIPNRLFYQ